MHVLTGTSWRSRLTHLTAYARRRLIETPMDPAVAEPGRGGLLRGWQWVLLAFLTSRLMMFATIYLSRLMFTRGKFWHPGSVLSVLLQFDAELWYVDIARRGYFYSASRESSMGFFPFYPLLIRAGGLLFADLRIAAVLVAHVCLLAAGLLLNALINVDYRDQRINRAAITLLMFGPASFFFSHAYTESTFLMLATASFLAAFKRQWLVACLCGMCLSATRNVGVLIAVPLFFEYLRQLETQGFSWKALLHPRILLLCLIPAGFGLFLLYGYVEFGDARAYFKATAAGWERTLVPPWRTIANAKNHPPFYAWYWGITLLSAIGVWLTAIYLRLRLSYIVWGSMLFTLYLCSNSLEAIGRYLSIVFPLFIGSGVMAVRFPISYVPLLTGSTALFILGTLLSAIGFWIT